MLLRESCSWFWHIFSLSCMRNYRVSSVNRSDISLAAIGWWGKNLMNYHVPLLYWPYLFVTFSEICQRLPRLEIQNCSKYVTTNKADDSIFYKEGSYCLPCNPYWESFIRNLFVSCFIHRLIDGTLEQNSIWQKYRKGWNKSGCFLNTRRIFNWHVSIHRNYVKLLIYNNYTPSIDNSFPDSPNLEHFYSIGCIA